MTLKQTLTATLVGTFLGALEGGVLYIVLLVLESRDGGFVIGGVSDWIIPIFIMGLICGGIIGAIIGAIVVLLNARGFAGLLVGMGVGLVATEIVFLSYATFSAITGLLAIATVLGGGSIGLLTALLTFRGNDSAVATDV
jgi:hypothetical protein